MSEFGRRLRCGGSTVSVEIPAVELPHVRHAMAAALREYADEIASPWQPIDSAPQGVPVLTRKGRGCHVGMLGRFGWCDWAGRPLHPTHWMHIPMDEE